MLQAHSAVIIPPEDSSKNAIKKNTSVTELPKYFINALGIFLKHVVWSFYFATLCHYVTLAAILKTSVVYNLVVDFVYSQGMV